MLRIEFAFVALPSQLVGPVGIALTIEGFQDRANGRSDPVRSDWSGDPLLLCLVVSNWAGDVGDIEGVMPRVFRGDRCEPVKNGRAID